MRIGMILDTSFPHDPRVENEAIALIEHGHEVFLFCLDYSNDQKEFEILNGIKICRQKVPPHLYSFSALAYTIPYYHFALKGKLLKFITGNNIEALHVHDIQIARSVFSANRTHNLPVVLDLHENRPEIMKYYAHVNSIPGKLFIKPAVWKKYEYRYIKEARKVIVVTREAAEYYTKEVPAEPDKFHVVPNSIRKEFYTSYKTDEDIINRYKNNFTILYLGNTGLRRGLETAIESLGYLIPVIPEIKLVVVGNSKTDHILKNLVTKSGYEEYVDLEGWKNPDLFQSYIIASDIGICPIHRNIHHDTTYANKIFQYMAFGKPIVVSNCRAQEAVVNKYECGLVFRDRDSEDFANKLITLYQNKDAGQIMADNARKAIVEHLGWHKASEGITNLYNSL